MEMRTHIAKWGNSLAVRLPKAIVDQIDVADGTAVEITVESGALTLRPAVPRYVLGDLLTDMTPQAMQEAFDWGPDRGRENVD
jgi:antitoxin MazE